MLKIGYLWTVVQLHLSVHLISTCVIETSFCQGAEQNYSLFHSYYGNRSMTSLVLYVMLNQFFNDIY